MAEELGYQWITDPAGNRWKVVGFNEVLAHLENEDGGKLNVGRSILQRGFKLGTWKMAEFEEAE